MVIDTGEVRVPRMAGGFAGRSQLLGGMAMELHEETVVDPRFGHYANQDLAEYRVAVNVEGGVSWIDEHDPHVNPMGSKGIFGTAATIASAIYQATGIRVRDLPITPTSSSDEEI